MKHFLLSTAGMFAVFFTVQAQNWNEVIKAVASDRAEGDVLGVSVAIGGNYAIVGAYREDEDINGENTKNDSGSAYIFKNDGADNWTQIQKIVASDREANDGFGYSVAISGDYAIVGGPYKGEYLSGENFMFYVGSAYIFKNDGTDNWAEIQKIVSSDREGNDFFGLSVALSGNYAIVGAYKEDHDVNGGGILNDSGSAYIFQNDGADNWSEIQKIVASDRAADDWFGHSVSISGDYAIIGADNEDEDESSENTRSDSGSAYIFTNNAGTWTEIQKIVASDRTSGDWFGNSVAICGDYAIVGAQGEDEDASGENTMNYSGAAYIFRNVGTDGWMQIRKIVASDRAANDFFGHSVSISGDYAVVAAPVEDEDGSGGNSMNDSGSAYIFKNDDEGNWNEIQKIVAFDRAPEDQFGLSVAISNNYIIAGANTEDEDANGENTFDKAGSAYIFKNKLVTETNEINTNTGLIISPNPTNGMAELNFAKVSNFGKVDISVTDIMGRIVEPGLIAALPETQQIDLTNQPAGLYFIRVQAAEGTYTAKVVKE